MITMYSYVQYLIGMKNFRSLFKLPQIDFTLWLSRYIPNMYYITRHTYYWIGILKVWSVVRKFLITGRMILYCNERCCSTHRVIPSVTIKPHGNPRPPLTARKHVAVTIGVNCLWRFHCCHVGCHRVLQCTMVCDV